MEIYISSDNLLKVTGLTNAAAGGTFINTATVTVTLRKESDDSAVVGQSWPATLSYVPSSNGNYEGVLEDGLSLSEGGRYYAEIVADAGADKKKTLALGPACRLRLDLSVE